MADVYLEKFDVWIEIDGIGRERLKESGYDEEFSRWKQKLDIYEKEGLQLEIVKSFNEFRQFIHQLTVE